MSVFKLNRPAGLSNMPPYYTREGDERHYQRIAAGIAAPSERPGAVIVVAEELALRPPAPIFWVDEIQESSLDRLFKRCIELQAHWGIEEFFGRTSDGDFLRSLSYWNDKQVLKSKPTFQLAEAPNSRSGNISFHINILRQRLSLANKTFWLVASEFLPPAPQELSQSEAHAATDSQFPVLAAAAYVVAALDTWPINPFEDNTPSFGNTEYDPLNYFNKEEF